MHHSPHHHGEGGGGIHLGAPSSHHYNLPHHLPSQHHNNHLGSGLVTSTSPISSSSLHSSSMHHHTHSNGSNGSDDGSSVSSGTPSAAAAHAAAVAAAAAAAGGATDLTFEDFTSMSPFLDPTSLHLAAAASNPYASSFSATGRNIKRTIIRWRKENIGHLYYCLYDCITKIVNLDNLSSMKMRIRMTENLSIKNHTFCVEVANAQKCYKILMIP